MSVDDVTWGEVRRCYCESDETIAAIAARLGVSTRAIQYRAKRNGWPSRRSKRRRLAREIEEARTEDTDGVSENVDVVVAGWVDDDEIVGSDVVVARLYRAIVRKLARLEARMERGKELSAAESERETRELSTMVRSFEKVTGVAAEIDRQRKPKVGGGASSAADAERMCGEIAERLERLHARRGVEGRSGEAEPK